MSRSTLTRREVPGPRIVPARWRLASAAAVGTLAAAVLTATPAVAADPDLPEDAWIDQFDSTTLDPAWSIHAESAANWSLETAPGSLVLDTLAGDTYQTANSAQNVFLVDIPDGDFTAITRVDVTVSSVYQGAGLIAWSDIDNYVRYGLTYVGDLNAASPVVLETDVETAGAFAAQPFVGRNGSTGETLRLQRVGDTVTASFWSGDAWTVASTMQIGFDITQVGLYGLASQAGVSMPATFDYFAVEAAEGEAIVPDGPFVLEADSSPAHLALDGGAFTLVTARPSTPLALVPTPSGDDAVTLATGDGDAVVLDGGVLTAVSGGTPSSLRIVDAGGGSVVLRDASAGGSGGYLGLTDGVLTAGDLADAIRFTLTDAPAAGAGATLSIDGDATSVEMSEDLYGIFYEDINYAADGGLYAELVRNRSFEFNTSDNASFTGLTAWSAVGGASLTVVNDSGRLNASNRNYLSLVAGSAGAGVRNASYNEGVAIEAGADYDFSVWARSATAQNLAVEITNAAGTAVHASGTVAVDGSNTWKKYQVALTANTTTNAGRLAVLAGAPSTVALDMVSLFPADQYQGPVNGQYGLRDDLAQMIADMNPSFLRFPGGCVTNVGTFRSYEESGYTDRRRTYQWKETIGPVEERATNWNFWGYNQSYGIGYYEYMLFAEDLGATPLPVVSVGANGCGSSIPELTDQSSELFQRWVDDTVDLIEFAIGDTSTEWGAVRASLGHPEPFDLKYIGLGNEENTPTFEANFPKFRDAIEAAYPEVTIISNTGPAASGARFDALWNFNRAQDVAMVDEHYYMTPEWFLQNTERYDAYDREGPHVFLGEYASRGNTMRNALAEAAYMTGLERNSDVVELASYAPLLSNEDYVQWSPDAIWFDNDEAWGSVNYWVQHMFSNNRGTQVVPSTLEQSLEGAPDLEGGVFLSTWSTAATYDDVVVTDAQDQVLFSDDFASGAGDWTAQAGSWSAASGAYVQSSTSTTDARTVVDGAYDADWSNYTLELKATKQAGAEGFLIGFLADTSGDYFWWNLGGWGNTRSALEKASNGARSVIAEGPATTIQAGKEYDVRIDVTGREIALYLDDVLQFTYVDEPSLDVYQVVTRDTDANELLVKMVNVSDSVHEVDIDVTDVTVLRDGATALEMVGPSQSAMNSKADPEAIVPVEREVEGASNAFSYQLPARSITFLRLPYEVEAPSLVLTDIATNPFKMEIEWLAATGITTGWATEPGFAEFRPLQNVNRDQMAAFLYRMSGSPDFEDPAVPTFADVPTTHVFYTEIEWLATQGITDGWDVDGVKYFRPTTAVNRDVIAAFLYRYAGSPDFEGTSQTFVDVPSTHVFYDEVEWLATTGITNGWDVDGVKQFRPTTAVKRDVMAAFLYRYAAM